VKELCDPESTRKLTRLENTPIFPTNKFVSIYKLSKVLLRFDRFGDIAPVNIFRDKINLLIRTKPYNDDGMFPLSELLARDSSSRNVKF
jgi:hypothetical protein